MTETYGRFLQSKNRRVDKAGFQIEENKIGGMLYPFQSHIVDWALNMGRSAIFEDCGLGKTPQQLECAKHVCEYTKKPVIIFAPLAVSRQTAKEGEKFDIGVNICRSQDEVVDGVNICNYEMLQHFDPAKFGGIVLDESSILKNYSGHYRKQLTEFAYGIHFRLAATATPAPNDIIEIINHSDFLSVLTAKEVLAMFFIQDGNTTHKWRVKGHAEDAFWEWMAQWSVAMRKPSDLGFDNSGFDLPELKTIQHTVDGHLTSDFLFPVAANTLLERRQARKESIDERVRVSAGLVNDSDRPWLVWCNLNMESDMLKKSIPDAIEVKGSDSPEHKIDALNGFAEGRYRVLITKPSIAGFGMNFQNCSDMAFVGLSDSFEQYYQAVRRCWRFGQTREVSAHVIVSECEGAVVANIARKELDAANMYAKIVEKMKGKHNALDQ